jgi:glycosyltransferase involved in cell wall biosynthesis
MVKDMAEQIHLLPATLVRIYNPVDIELVRESGTSRANPYCGAGPQLVAAGRLSDEKGFDLLLAAMPQVVASLPTAQLTILGQGPRKAVLEAQVRRLGLTESVRFPGFQQNPWTYLCHADLFVLPSRREAFSNVLLEALVLETPAVAMDCPGAIREIYGDNPAVRLVPAGDSSALAEAIVAQCQSVGDERDNAKVSADWMSKFSLSQVLGEYDALFLG